MIKNSLLWAVFVLVIFSSLPLGYAQSEETDRTIFSIHPQSFQRASTSSKDKAEGYFLPQYQELASQPEVGITRSDWKKYPLSLERFVKLDENEDDIISQEELNKDPFMGESKTYKQDSSLIAKVCREDFPDYKERLRRIQNQYPRLRSEGSSDGRFDDFEYALNETLYPKEKLPLELFSQSGSQEIASKVYLQAKNGQIIRKKVDLGSLAWLLLKEDEEERSWTLPIFGLAVFALVAVVMLLTPKFK